MMFAIVKIFFLAGWLVVIVAVVGLRIFLALLKLIVRLVKKAVGSDRGKGYKVKYYG